MILLMDGRICWNAGTGRDARGRQKEEEDYGSKRKYSKDNEGAGRIRQKRVPF